MEPGIEPDLNKYFRKIINSIIYSLLWMIAGITAGIYYKLAFFSEVSLVYNILFYTGLLASLIFLIRYLIGIWR